LRIDSEIIRFGRAAHQLDSAPVAHTAADLTTLDSTTFDYYDPV
jgi:hypothetical protein